MKLFAMLLLAWLLVELVVDEVDGSCLKRTPCSGCGRGARCMYGKYCTAFCKTVTIKREEKFRKYCPRKTQSNPYNHRLDKRSVSHAKRSAGMVEISYKEPFLDMLRSVKYERSSTARREILNEIADDVEIDAGNCDTRTNVLASIASLARIAARYSSSGGRYQSYISQLSGMFLSLDDDDIDCEVEASSPLAKYRLCARGGCGRGQRCIYGRCVYAG